MRNIEKELHDLKDMSLEELRVKYATLFGDSTISGNRQWMIRRCAWRMQVLAEGGLSEKARRRARQLARDQDIRVIPPRGIQLAPLDRPADVKQPARKYIHRTRDSRLPMPGGQLARTYKGHLYEVDVLDNGFSYDGQKYESLSAVAHAITGSHWNGYKFFNLTDAYKESE